MISIIILAVTAAATAAIYAAHHLYANKIAEAFGMGVDFGKAIALMTEDAKAAIAELHLPAQRESSE